MRRGIPQNPARDQSRAALEAEPLGASNEGHGVQEKKKDEESTDEEKEESTDEEEEEEELMEKNLRTQGKKFKYTGCAYRSASHVNLKVHMRTHTGNKPYKCTLRLSSRTGFKFKTTHAHPHEAIQVSVRFAAIDQHTQEM
uniref:C2H2-type domain-containing protein n=1 Tax=Globodera rostochiensis TaxID=31243 RepID=A0A914IFU8_GLORO